MPRQIVRPQINVAFLQDTLQECVVARYSAAIWRRRQSGLEPDPEDVAFLAKLRAASAAEIDEDIDNDSKDTKDGVVSTQAEEHVTAAAEPTAKANGGQHEATMTNIPSPKACSVSSVTAISEGQTYKQADESTAHNGTGTSGTFTSPTQKSVSSPSTGEDFSPNNNKSNNILLAEVVNIASDHIQEPAPASINLEELIRKNPNRPLKDVVSDLLHKVAEEEGAEGTRKLLRTLPPRVWDLFQNQFPTQRVSKQPSDLAVNPTATTTTTTTNSPLTLPTDMPPATTSTGARASTSLGRPLFPEFGPEVILADGRIVCKAHDKGICNDCRIDYSDVEIDDKAVEGLGPEEIHHLLNWRDAIGGFIPIFKRGGGRFADQDALERETEYPSLSERARHLAITFQLGNQLSVPASFGPATRFVPQWDNETMGRFNIRYMERDYTNLPSSILGIDKLSFVHCDDCQLTWHAGHKMLEAAGSHPSHHCQYDSVDGPTRSLFVHVDGAFTPACAGTLAGASGQGEGSLEAPVVVGAREARAGMGVYFAEGSKYNVSEPFARRVFAFPDPRNGNHPAVAMTHLTPLLGAVARALQTVRERVAADRAAEIRAATVCSSQHAARAAERFRLVVCTDSAELVDGICCRYMQGWESYSLTEEVVALAKKNDKEKAKARAKAKAKAKKKKGKGKGKEKEDGEEEEAQGEGQGQGQKEGPPPAIEGHVSWDDFVVNPNDRKLVLVNTATDCLIPNSDGYLKVFREQALLATIGVTVKWYLIPAKANAAADRLAKAALAQDQ